MDDAREVMETVATNAATIKNGAPPVLSDQEWDEAKADAKEHALEVLGEAPAA